MKWIIAATLLLAVSKAALCFNIDPVAWKTLTNPAAGFGYQVVQRPNDLLVSAPLAQYTAYRRGEIYRCHISDTNCWKIQPTTVPDHAVNTSLGLTMTYDSNNRNTLACGPTVPKDCKSITMYNGVCYQIDISNRFGDPIPRSRDECSVQADIAFLLDGSGSVGSGDFQRMKSFVKGLIASFLAGDTKFSVSQFSDRRQVHFYFDEFFPSQSWESKIDIITQLNGGTYTAAAIQHVVNNVFSQLRGSRPNVKKVLIVITDGESHDRNSLWYAAALAEQQNIVRFAIGVGNAFNNPDARGELQTIASIPSPEHVFRVDNFNALDAIKGTLQDRIFSIEGSQSSGESLKMEMSQQGFSAAFVPGGYQLGVVGANGWRGGYIQYKSELPSTYADESMEPDSYLGYSMAVAQTWEGSVTIVGAPRYQHRGAVQVHYKKKNQTINPSQWQTQFPTGAYFGAVVCAMRVDYDLFTDVILISAPMYVEADREGRVYVCTINNENVDCRLDSSPLVLRGEASKRGRFGSSLAVLPDLNADGLNDLAVGAPQENDGQGSIYIFHGEGGQSISSTFSQRIAASEVRSGLRFFGMSISQSALDQSGDQLPDLAVGSKGAVVLLRSRPIVTVEATVSYSPPQIPTQNTDCSKPLEHTAKICFNMKRLSTILSKATAKIHFNLTLDANRKVPNNRAYFSEKQKRDVTETVVVALYAEECRSKRFLVEACQEDVVNPLSNELRFTFEGLPLDTKLRPSLAEQAQTAASHPLSFEINCGTDNKCVDNLKLDFSFTNSSVVKVGIDELLDVTVSVENMGENSYNSRVILTYPVGLSYRKVTSLQGRIECNSLDSEDRVRRGQTVCVVDRPIFKGNAKALFIVSYGIGTNTQYQSRISVTANATSGNNDHSPSSQLYKTMEIPVKYSISVTTESYNNFTFGKNDLKKPFKQSIKVTNEFRDLNFTVVIRVPVRLGDKDIWVDLSSFQIQDCIRGRDEVPVIQDFVPKIQKNKLVDCSVASCRVFRCTRAMARLESKAYVISANLSSGWIEQIGLESAKFLLTSTVSLEYDRDKYIFFSTGSNNNPPVRKVEAEVEVYSEPDFTKEIVGGSLGGLAFLALITAGLYKAGFFKSKYQDMINENAEGEGGSPEPDAAPAE